MRSLLEYSVFSIKKYLEWGTYNNYCIGLGIINNLAMFLFPLTEYFVYSITWEV